MVSCISSASTKPCGLWTDCGTPRLEWTGVSLGCPSPSTGLLLPVASRVPGGRRSPGAQLHAWLPGCLVPAPAPPVLDFQGPQAWEMPSRVAW